MIKLIYILPFITFAQNKILDCAETIKTEQFIRVSDTLLAYNSYVMLQSGSGMKVNYVSGNVRFLHGKLALEEDVYKKPILVIANCINGEIEVSTRIDLQVGKSCIKRIKRFEQ